MEHSHCIFPEYLEKDPYKIPGNIPVNNVPGILNVHFFKVDQEIQQWIRLSLVDKTVPDIQYMSFSRL